MAKVSTLEVRMVSLSTVLSDAVVHPVAISMGPVEAGVVLTLAPGHLLVRVLEALALVAMIMQIRGKAMRAQVAAEVAGTVLAVVVAAEVVIATAFHSIVGVGQVVLPAVQQVAATEATNHSPAGMADRLALGGLEPAETRTVLRTEAPAAGEVAPLLERAPAQLTCLVPVEAQVAHIKEAMGQDITSAAVAVPAVEFSLFWPVNWELQAA